MSIITLRSATTSDSDELTSVLNEIVVIGGTTAWETELSVADFESAYISGERCIACFLAERDGMILGFQSLKLKPTLPAGWLDIATFARVKPKVQGVGSALFGVTKAFAAQQDYEFINATIRADNVPGLGYYSNMGFVDYSVTKAVPLKSGLPVDRILKRYALRAS